MKNHVCGLKVPLLTLSNVMFRCQNLIGSNATTHSNFTLIGPCNTHLNTQSHKDTYAQTIDI